METAPEENLILICCIAFLAVVVLLGMLAVIIHVTVRCFPVRKPDRIDPAIVTAIGKAVTAHWPGARVSGLQEIRPARDR